MKTSLLNWLAAGSLIFLSTAAWSQNIVVGRSLPLTGQLKAIGEPKRDGGDAFINKLNAAGGINGRKIEVITLDDAYVADNTVANLRKLAEESKAVAFFSLLRVPVKDGAIPILDELKVPAIGVASATDLLRSRVHKYGFPVRASFSDEARKLANHVKVVGISRVALVYQDVPLGQTTREVTEVSLKETGLTPNIFKLNADAKNLAEVVGKVADSQPQAIFLLALTPASAALVSEFRKRSVNANLYTYSSTDAFVFAKLLGNQAAGVAISQVVPIPSGSRIKIVAEYVQAVKDLGRSTPTGLGLEGYIEAKVMAEGLKRAGANPSPESLVRALETMRDMDLGGFFVNYTPQAHTGSLFVEIDMIGPKGELIR